MDRSVNDSGFGSPSHWKSESEENVHFYYKTGHSISREIIGGKSKSLAEVLLRYDSKIKLKNLLFRAKIRGHRETTSVNPFLLPCGFIEPDTEVESEQYERMIYDETNQPNKEADLKFFISLKDRKHKTPITHANYKYLRTDYVCVTARPGQTFEAAMNEDGRFKNVERFRLSRKIDGAANGPEVDMNDRPSDYNDALFVVHVGKDLRSSKGKQSQSKGGAADGLSTSCSGEAEVPNIKVERVDEIDGDELPGLLREKNVMFVFPKDVENATKEEVYSRMAECLKARARFTLVDPKHRDEGKYEKFLKNLVKTQFSSQAVLSRLVAFSKLVYKLYDSIGHIKCGDIYGTCFLVSAECIVTNWHVVRDIKKARRQSTQINYSNVFVYFNYEKFERIGTGPRLLPLENEGNILSEEFDYAFLRLEHSLTDRKPLGTEVRCSVPDGGKVSIVGHPSGREKQEELCTILPHHRRSSELQRRVQQGLENCAKKPMECQTTSIDPHTMCVHMYLDSLQRLSCEKAAVTYDVGSMGVGSSGSPVINMRGEIIALHTLGFALGRSHSVIEVGVSFKAIIQDLENNGHADFVKKTFPNRSLEAMDVG